MILNLGPLGKSRAKMPPEFRLTIGGNVYTRSSFLAAANGYISGIGAYAEKVRSDGTVDWTMAICKSGSLEFQRVVDKVDLFLADAGEDGGPGYHNDNLARSCGGPGGRGGKTYTHKNQSVAAGTTYVATVSTTNSGATSLNRWTAASGSRNAGGTGAYVNDNSSSGGAATKGAKGVPAFGDDNTELWAGWTYGNGGGAGGARNASYYSISPSAGGDGTAASGGAYNSAGGAARNNTADGGGGGGYDLPTWTDYPGGAGGSGIIMIRNAR